MGGKTDRSDLYIAPAILTGVSYDDKVMEEEIFGPILPIVTIKSIDHAVELINSRSIQGHKPLAVYIFSQTQSVVDSVLSRTSSGGCTVNDVILHMGLFTSLSLLSLLQGPCYKTAPGQFEPLEFQPFLWPTAFDLRKMKKSNQAWTPFHSAALATPGWVAITGSSPWTRSVTRRPFYIEI